jgi:multidrug efflux pump subunit AcrA (membrane-fusion protein)
MVNLVARVAEPYGSASGQAPLAVGLFVEAEILGRQLQEVVELPRIAMVGPKTVFVIDNDQRLRRTEVEVLRKRGDSVLVGGGLANGDRVCLTPMDDAVEGMRVRIEAGAMELSQR